MKRLSPYAFPLVMGALSLLVLAERWLSPRRARGDVTPGSSVAAPPQSKEWTLRDMHAHLDVQGIKLVLRPVRAGRVVREEDPFLEAYLHVEAAEFPEPMAWLTTDRSRIGRWKGIVLVRQSRTNEWDGMLQSGAIKVGKWILFGDPGLIDRIVKALRGTE